ncbi:Ig-like domain-containing protein [Methanobrevibacter sp.]|uniref:Ig-like domain-containing protein n=1 Tax=Methanobrevibacter sp. TaxID=66852 RepID=UPI0038910135
MKINKVMIICICILSILCISAVSANENITDLNETDHSPNIEVPTKIWKDGDYNITVESNEESEIDITGAINYNSTITAGKTSIPIKNLTTGRHNIHINASNIQKEYNITVLKENPHWDMDFDFLEGEILFGPPYDHESLDTCLIILNRPEGLTGNFSFYVDNELIYEWDAQDLTEEPIYYAKYYEEQIYNFTLKYSGDDYFYPVSKSKIVEFCPILITIPEEVVLGYDDTIYIYSDYDFRNGNVSIKINNRTVFKKDNINSDLHYMLEYSLNKLKANQQYDIEVIYSSDSGNKTKKATVNVSDRVSNYVTFMGKYSYEQDNFKYTYGDESNFYYILSPKLKLNITIDNKKVKATYEDDYYIVNIGDLTPGTHRITVSYDGDGKYAKNTFSNDFEVVSKAKYPTSVKQNELNYLTLELPEDAIGNLTVDFENLDNAEFKYFKTAEVKNSKVDIPMPTEHVGNYQFKAYFNGNYELNEILGKYLVKDSAKWKLNNEYWPIMNENLILTLKLANDGNGNLTVEISKDGKLVENYTTAVANGSCTIKLPTNHIGEYDVKTSFNGNYELLPYKKSYEVDSEYYINTVDEELRYNSNESVSIELPKNGTGTLTLEIKYAKNDNYTVYKTVELNKGNASIQMPTNRVGKVYYNVLYNGNYELYNCTDQEILIIPAYSFKNNILTLVGDKELNGKFSIVDYSTDSEFSANIKNGTAKIDLTKYIKKMNEPSYFALSFTSDDIEDYFIDTVKINPNVKIIAKDIEMYYGDSKTFTAKVYRNEKLVGKGEKITIKIGSTKYKLKTDKNGRIKLKITPIPGEYTIKSSYKGVVFKNKLTVKHLLTLKPVKVKKSAKKLVLTSTLKKGKKAVKNKIITFKFNGKTYTAKTNKKGIAKVTIAKSTLKKLKVGKKITYKATYMKDTVKHTVKVQK